MDTQTPEFLPTVTFGEASAPNSIPYRAAIVNINPNPYYITIDIAHI